MVVESGNKQVQGNERTHTCVAFGREVGRTEVARGRAVPPMESSGRFPRPAQPNGSPRAPGPHSSAREEEQERSGDTYLNVSIFVVVIIQLINEFVVIVDLVVWWVGHVAVGGEPAGVC